MVEAAGVLDPAELEVQAVLGASEEVEEVEGAAVLRPEGMAEMGVTESFRSPQYSK